MHVDDPLYQKRSWRFLDFLWLLCLFKEIWLENVLLLLFSQISENVLHHLSHVLWIFIVQLILEMNVFVQLLPLRYESGLKLLSNNLLLLQFY